MNKVKVSQVQRPHTKFQWRDHAKFKLSSALRASSTNYALIKPECRVLAEEVPVYYLIYYQFKRRREDPTVKISSDTRFYRHYIYKTPWAGQASDHAPFDARGFMLQVNNVEEININECELADDYEGALHFSLFEDFEL